MAAVHLRVGFSVVYASPLLIVIVRLHFLNKLSPLLIVTVRLHFLINKRPLACSIHI